MRYALFTDQHTAKDFAATVEDLCDQHRQKQDPVIRKYAAWIPWLNRWVVSMEYEPDLAGIEVVDTIEQPAQDPGIGE